ncbi:MAG: AAA family ATPase [Smithellaceae bacterium]
MEYYSILNFKKEPFSNSPEPEFFFEAPKYVSCLQKLELAVRLRRGLNVVIGDIGTGKTTLCRKLIQQLSFSPKDSQEIETHLLLDPSSDNIIGFLQTISLLIGIKDLDGSENEWQLKEKIKNYLFNKGVNENKIIVLIIDEGQKIPENCIEILREFLNYETNNFKLLQIIIFAQLEFKQVLKRHANLSDRINYSYYLSNMKFKNMREMIKYRINVAMNFEKSPDFFTFGALLAIYIATEGYPRKVVSLCHQVILNLIISGKNKANSLVVRRAIKEMYAPLFRKIRRAILATFLITSVGIFVLYDPFDTIKFYKQLSASQLKKMQLSTSTPVLPAKTLSAPAPSTTSETPQMQPAQVTPVSAIKSVSPPVSATSSPTPGTQMPAVIPQKKIQEIKMPDSLGTLTMKKGRTLLRTINNIYGEINSEIIEKIIKANPHISNMNKITAEQKINIPSIPANISPVKNGDFVVVLEKGNDIKIIYDLFHENTYKKTLPPMLFFPFWNSREGMTFAVILDKSFSNPQAAREAINVLPAALAAKAQIISRWDNETVFFNRQILKK